MSESQVLAGIATVAKEHLNYGGPVEPETPLVSAMALDSIRMLTLVVELENHFKVYLEEGDEQGIETVGDLASILKKRMEEEASA